MNSIKTFLSQHSIMLSADGPLYNIHSNILIYNNIKKYNIMYLHVFSCREKIFARTPGNKEYKSFVFCVARNHCGTDK